MLSTSAESIADTQSMMIAVSTMLSAAQAVISSANCLSTQACSKPQTIIKRAQKNIKTESSSFSSIF